jgi:hypothetical protein
MFANEEESIYDGRDRRCDENRGFMRSSVPLLQTIYNGTRTFLRDDFSDEGEFIHLVAELRQLDALGFLNGYRENFSKDAEKKVIGIASLRGLSDEGTDYLVRIGGTTLGTCK